MRARKRCCGWRGCEVVAASGGGGGVEEGRDVGRLVVSSGMAVKGARFRW